MRYSSLGHSNGGRRQLLRLAVCYPASNFHYYKALMKLSPGGEEADFELDFHLVELQFSLSFFIEYSLGHCMGKMQEVFFATSMKCGMYIVRT